MLITRTILYEERPHWGERQAYHRRLDLYPLSKLYSRILEDEVLQKVEAVPDALRDMVLARGENCELERQLPKASSPT